MQVDRAVAEGRFPASLQLLARCALAVEKGDKRTSEAMLGRILKMVNDPRTSAFDRTLVNFNLLPVLSRDDMVGTTLQILSRSSSEGVVPAYDWLLLNPNLAPLRGDARFQKIVSQSRVQFDQMLQVLEQARSRGELPKYLDKALFELLPKLNNEAARLKI